MFNCDLVLISSLGFKHTLLIKSSNLLESPIHSILNASGAFEEGSSGGDDVVFRVTVSLSGSV